MKEKKVQQPSENILPLPSELKEKRIVLTKTIAVLPFVNISASAENEYFSDGITEEIINALAKISNLKVVSRTSSFFFKNKNIPVKQIGKELNASVILEGSVRLSGDTIRITAQLIQAKEDFHFWSETWDRKLENIFEIQDEISLLIADKLRENFGHFEIQDRLVDKQTENIDAYEFSLKAKYHSNKWNPDDKRIAISLYEQALELDPNHTESYLGLAECYGFMAATGFMPALEAWQKSAELTNKALLLNDQLPGVHYQLAQLAFFTACDYTESFNQTSKAIELKPNYVEAQQFMSFLYIIAGNKEKALEHLQISLSINPLSQETHFFSAYFHYMVEDYSGALEKLNKCLEYNPKNTPAHSVKCYCLLKMSRWQEVIDYFENMPEGMLVEGDKLGFTTIAYAVKKDPKNMARCLQALLEFVKGPEGYRAHAYLFFTYAVGGEIDKAFEWIRESIATKSSFLLFNFADPLVNSIKADPRYVAFHKIIYQSEALVILNRKKKELMEPDAVASCIARLQQHMQDESPYLDPELSLRTLAKQLPLHPNQLSWLLNESIGKNFNEYINHYRIEAFKKLSNDPKNKQITLIGLAYDSGFNSKTVFNTYFKKETGLTPKEYLKLQ